VLAGSEACEATVIHRKVTCDLSLVARTVERVTGKGEGGTGNGVCEDEVRGSSFIVHRASCTGFRIQSAGLFVGKLECGVQRAW
jgi:hypothetical protein